MESLTEREELGMESEDSKKKKRKRREEAGIMSRCSGHFKIVV